MGVKEYLFKPITRDMVARHFSPIIMNRSRRPEALQGGRVVTITGVRGGVGASMIAANLAWHLGKRANRHTVLLDGDLYRGSCALLLNVKPGSGLRTALETPQRTNWLTNSSSSRMEWMIRLPILTMVKNARAGRHRGFTVSVRGTHLVR